MKIILVLKEKLKQFWFILTLLIVLLFQNNYQKATALTMENYQSGQIVEELRLKVPVASKAAWLTAEKEVWDPWLSSQKGFLGRQLYWDKEKEEALILVNWESKKLWKSIPMSEVNVVQEKFEDNVKTALKLEENPFELIYEGELNKQG
jgi:uncharacterized protein (TIGR03792 family)